MCQSNVEIFKNTMACELIETSGFSGGHLLPLLFSDSLDAARSVPKTLLVGTFANL
jgi:hypothetical protein